MSNKKQQVELTDITTPLLAATQGFTMEDRDASTSTPIIDKKTIHSLLECAEIGENRGNERPPSICKVSRILRENNESSYEPQLVSIGPMHRENMKLKEFEWQKKRYLGDLLSRCDSTPKEILEACLREVNTLIPKIRESYACVIENCSDDELAGMMVMDGCFILEFCFKHEEEDKYLPNKMQNLRIAMDLMLLENQVPFFVLQALFNCSMGKRSFTLSDILDAYLAPYIKLFWFQWREEIPTTYVDSDSTHDHVLGYLHKRYQLLVPKSWNLAAKSRNPVDDEALRGHTIVELDRSGMNFQPQQEYTWSMTLKFQPSLFPSLLGFRSMPTLLMPTLLIDDFTELILRNFIAYEQVFPQDHYYFTSYAHAMDKLIDTQEDIAKLVESKVLVNMLVSNQEAADMINNICKTLFVTDFYYAQEFQQMDMYYNGYWPTKRRIYFSNPWNAINLLGGFIVSLATVIAAIFAVLQYFA